MKKATGTSLVTAITIANNAHAGQTDKIGLPYILHPLAVMESVDSLDAKAVAVLHDVLEDTAITLSVLQVFPELPEHVLSAVEAMTHRKGETNLDYWGRVKVNPLALEVKLADIAHNTSPKRMKHLDEVTRTRLEKKYKKALAFLLS